MDSSSDPVKTVHALLHALNERDWDAFADLVHPDAQMDSVAHQNILVGRDAVVKSTRSAAESAVFELAITAVEQLDDRTVMVVGSMRRPSDLGGFADSTLAWVDEVRDGMLWRSWAFNSAAEARRSFLSRGMSSPHQP